MGAAGRGALRLGPEPAGRGGTGLGEAGGGSPGRRVPAGGTGAACNVQPGPGSRPLAPPRRQVVVFCCLTPPRPPSTSRWGHVCEREPAEPPGAAKPAPGVTPAAAGLRAAELAGHDPLLGAGGEKVAHRCSCPAPGATRGKAFISTLCFNETHGA